MSILRNEHEEKINRIEVINSGCPICNNDVKGNERYLFLCSKCNILFRREDLKLNREHVEKLIKEKIIEKFDKNSDKIKILDEKITLKKLEQKNYFFASKKSNIVHANNCPFAKNIKKENIIKFKQIEDAKDYKKCKCVGEIYG